MLVHVHTSRYTVFYTYSIVYYMQLYFIALHYIILQAALTDVNLDYSIVCLLFYAVELRIFRPPNGTRGFEQLTTIDCSECLPTCHSRRYALDYSYADDSNSDAKNSCGYLNVFYKDLGAIKFRQELAFDFMDLVG